MNLQCIFKGYSLAGDENSTVDRWISAARLVLRRVLPAGKNEHLVNTHAQAKLLKRAP